MFQKYCHSAAEDDFVIQEASGMFVSGNNDVSEVTVRIFGYRL